MDNNAVTTPMTEQRLTDEVYDTNGDPVEQLGYRSTTQVDELFKLIDGLGYIAGSICAWMAEYDQPKWTPGDIDIFAVSLEAFKLIELVLVQHRYVRIGGSSNDLVSTFAPGAFEPCEYLTIQVVKPHPSWTESDDIRRSIVTSFDMTCSRGLLDNYGDHGTPVLYGDVYLGNLAQAKIIRVNNPVKTLARMMKYHARGYAFSPWEQIKVLRSWEPVPAEKKQAITEELHANDLPDDDDSGVDSYGSWYDDEAEYWDAESSFY